MFSSPLLPQDWQSGLYWGEKRNASDKDMKPCSRHSKNLLRDSISMVMEAFYSTSLFLQLAFKQLLIGVTEASMECCLIINQSNFCWWEPFKRGWEIDSLQYIFCSSWKFGPDCIAFITCFTKNSSHKTRCDIRGKVRVYKSQGNSSEVHGCLMQSHLMTIENFLLEKKQRTD